MSVNFIKIFGERNCGTNYLQGMVSRNFEVDILPGKVNPKFRRLKELEWVRFLYFNFTFNHYFGWKHAQIDSMRISANPKSKDTLFLVITKNPYSFLLSLYKKPYHYKEIKSDFETFLKTPWETVGFELGPANYANPIELWNAKCNSYLEFKSSGLNVEVIKYEDLVSGPDVVFDRLYYTYGLVKTENYFSNITKSMKGDKQKDFNFYKDYYLQQQWKDKLKSREIEIINRSLNHEVLNRLDYQSICV
jgi:hypothetical protein